LLRGSNKGTAPPPTYQVDVTVEPASALVQIDSRSLGQGHVQQALARDGTSHSLLVSADGYEPQSLAFRDEPPPSHVVLTRSPSTSAANSVQVPVAATQKNDLARRDVALAAAPSKKGARPTAASPKVVEAAPSVASPPPAPAAAQEDGEWASHRKRTDNKNPWGE
jgi:hypothetical protein